jgi:hypothetical protein
MNALLSGPVLLFAYSVVGVAGLLVIALAVASLLRSFTPGRQARPQEGAERKLSRASLYSLGLGAAVLGGVGLLALLLFDLSPGASLAWALGAGLLVGLFAELLLVYLPSRRQVKEAVIAIDADGREARVVIPIPATGLGEVAYDDGDETINLGARSADGRAIPSGVTVIIERVTNRVAIVQPVGAPGTLRPD